MPMARIPHQVRTVTDHPIALDMRAMPYVEIAAPTYTQLLHTPLTVAALPNSANLPGRQEISKKFAPCIAAQMNAVRKSDKILKKAPFIDTKIASGTAATSDMPKSIADPDTSLRNNFFLCKAVMTAMLIIEKIGKIIETRVDSDTSLPKASE